MAKEKKYTREEILEIVGEALKETNEILTKSLKETTEEKGNDKEDLFDLLNTMKYQLLLMSLAECIKSKLQ